SADHPILQHAADAIGRLVERREHTFGELAGLAEDRFDEVWGSRLVSGQLRDPVEPSHFLEHETHIGERGGVSHSRFQAGNGAAARSYPLTTLPGFMILAGSSGCLARRARSVLTGGLWRGVSLGLWGAHPAPRRV